MNWISVNDQLPINGQAVLVRREDDNWHCKHTLNGVEHKIWRWMAAQFITGKTKEEVEKTGFIECADEWANNKKPYIWKSFGANTLFGQDVTHWCAITDPMD